jgi:hypothetical protein
MNAISQTRGHPHNHNKTNRRCTIKGCSKLAKDFFEGEYLCRIHAPSRLGYKLNSKRR